ncbi:MAG: dimethylsulfonioproprionate lyase family protein [Granulosicoccus sp.]
MTAKTTYLYEFLSLIGEHFATHDSCIADQLSKTLQTQDLERRTAVTPTGFDTTEVHTILSACQNTALQKLARFEPQLPWRSAGFGKLPISYRKSIAVIEFIGPDGIFEMDAIRIGLLVQSAGITYPTHWHAAEELYFILDGTAHWSTDDHVPRPRPPGDFIHHHSMQPHCVTTIAEPLVAMWGWSGDVDGSSYSL